MPWEHANFCCDDAFGPTGFPDCWDEVHLWLQSLDQVPFCCFSLNASTSTVSVIPYSCILIKSLLEVGTKKNVFPMQ